MFSAISWSPRLALWACAGIAIAFALLALAQQHGPRYVPPASAGAPVIQVDTLADSGGDGECSLRRAIVNANDDAATNPECAAGGGEDTITFSVSGTITLESDLPAITDADGLTIDGDGAITVSGDNKHRPFFVDVGAALTLVGITVTEGLGDFGGGIRFNGSLTLTEVVVSGNEATDSGGGIYGGSFEVVLVVTDSTISGNSSASRGGGINTGVDSEVTLTNSVVSDNRADNSGGGMTHGVGSVVTISSSVIADNETGDRGGGITIGVDAVLSITDSFITGNSASVTGGGINSGVDSVVMLHGSTVSGNSSEDRGGGFFSSGALILDGSTISGNEAAVNGGGIFNRIAASTVVNSTISGNTAGELGGGLYIPQDFGVSEMAIINSTITTNAAESGGGLYVDDTASVTLTNTIVAGQQTGDDCAGDPAVSEGHNLDSDGTCGLTEDGDISEGDANLGPLADNGGPTLTHRLLEGSDAIDSGDDDVCADEPVDGVDQRGVPRPQGQACDIGAFETGALRIWGDLDCDGTLAIGEALKTARYLLGLSVSQEEACPEPAEVALVNVLLRLWGDVDCDETVAIGDALKIARHLLGLSVSQEDGCPEIGTLVDVAEGAGG